MPKLYFWDAVHSRWVYVAGAAAPGSAVTPTGGLTTDCLTFPRSARICNPVAGQITFATPGGAFAMDETGVTWPGGHRIEVVNG